VGGVQEASQLPAGVYEREDALIGGVRALNIYTIVYEGHRKY
jgi:hypothetical protein